MARIPVTIATWDYDRVRAIIDGRVQIEGCDTNYLPMPVEEVFHRAYFHEEFDITEIGFSPYLIARSRDLTPYVAIPVFLSRTFRHSAIYIRTDRGINDPDDLRGRQVGVPEYQMSAALWARGMLKDDFGIDVADMNWIQGGLEQPGRKDKFPLNLPPDFPLQKASSGRSLSQMLADGEIDALFSARAPSCFIKGMPNVGRLYPDFRIAEQEYFRRTGIFPIMHAVGIKRELVQRYPWLPLSVYKAFAEAKRIAERELREVAALKVMLPWLASEVQNTEDVMGKEFWPYGIAPNLKTLEAMTRYSFEQGLSVRHMDVGELFAESTLEEIVV